MESETRKIKFSTRILKALHFALPWYFSFLSVKKYSGFNIYESVKRECKQVYIPLFLSTLEENDNNKEREKEKEEKELDKVINQFLGRHEARFWKQCKDEWAEDRSEFTTERKKRAQENNLDLWKNDGLNETERLTLCCEYLKHYNRIVSKVLEEKTHEYLLESGAALQSIFMIATANAWYYHVTTEEKSGREMKTEISKTIEIENILLQNRILQVSTEEKIEIAKCAGSNFYLFKTKQLASKMTQTGKREKEKEKKKKPQFWSRIFF